MTFAVPSRNEATLEGLVVVSNLASPREILPWEREFILPAAIQALAKITDEYEQATAPTTTVRERSRSPPRGLLRRRHLQRLDNFKREASPRREPPFVNIGVGEQRRVEVVVREDVMGDEPMQQAQEWPSGVTLGGELVELEPSTTDLQGSEEPDPSVWVQPHREFAVRDLYLGTHVESFSRSCD